MVFGFRNVVIRFSVHGNASSRRDVRLLIQKPTGRVTRTFLLMKISTGKSFPAKEANGTNPSNSKIPVSWNLAYCRPSSAGRRSQIMGGREPSSCFRIMSPSGVNTNFPEQEKCVCGGWNPVVTFRIFLRSFSGNGSRVMHSDALPDRATVSGLQENECGGMIISGMRDARWRLRFSKTPGWNRRASSAMVTRGICSGRWTFPVIRHCRVC